MEIPSCMKHDEKLMVRIDLVRVCQDSTSFYRKMSIFSEKPPISTYKPPKSQKILLAFKEHSWYTLSGFIYFAWESSSVFFETRSVSITVGSAVWLIGS